MLNIHAYINNNPPSKEWRFVEFFAGEANVSNEIRLASYKGVSLDISLWGSGHGLNNSSWNGVSKLNVIIIFSLGHILPFMLFCVFLFFGKGPCEIEPKLRLALLTLLKLQPDSLGILAPVCSSMGFFGFVSYTPEFVCYLLGTPQRCQSHRVTWWPAGGLVL